MSDFATRGIQVAAPGEQSFSQAPALAEGRPMQSCLSRQNRGCLWWRQFIVNAAAEAITTGSIAASVKIQIWNKDIVLSLWVNIFPYSKLKTCFIIAAEYIREKGK